MFSTSVRPGATFPKLRKTSSLDGLRWMMVSQSSNPALCKTWNLLSPTKKHQQQPNFRYGYNGSHPVFQMKPRKVICPTLFQRDESTSSGNVPGSSPFMPYPILKICLSIILMSTGFVFFEMKRLMRLLNETIPDFVAEAGERVPSKYIYGILPSMENWHWHSRYFSWFSACQTGYNAWYYVNQTRSDDPLRREEAIKKLVSMKGLSDSECVTIASALDFKTAVALSHAGAKPSMVCRPATLHPDKKNMSLSTKFREILAVLPPDSIHEAMLNTCFAALKLYSPTDAEIDRHMELSTSFHHDFDALRPQPRISEVSFLKPCLQALLSHSRIKEQVPAMLEAGVMDLLLVISQKYKADHDIMSIVLKTFSSLSCSSECDTAFEDSGILGLITEFAASDDVRVSFPARKTLHNLDRDNSKYTLPPGIYQVYPDFRTSEDERKIDIVFVHGIMGGAFRTWRSQDLNAVWRFKKREESVKEGLCKLEPPPTVQNEVDTIREKILNPYLPEPESREPDPAISTERTTLFQKLVATSKKLLKLRDNDLKPRNRELRNGEMYYFPADEEIPMELEMLPVSPSTKCWPRDWLPLDFPNTIRVVCVDFETFITHWNPVMPVENLGRTISERSQELVEKLVSAGIGSRPVVWVCHSAGGIIVKEVLELAEKSNKKELQDISRNTKGVVFCSTPHFGSSMVGLGKTVKSIWLPTVEIIELTKGSNELHRIDQNFQKLMSKYSYKIVSFGELCPTLGSVGFSKKLVQVDSSDPGYGEYYALRVDHLNICKPRSRRSFVYAKIRDFIGETLKEVH